VCRSADTGFGMEFDVWCQLLIVLVCRMAVALSYLAFGVLNLAFAV